MKRWYIIYDVGKGRQRCVTVLAHHNIHEALFIANQKAGCRMTQITSAVIR